MRRTNAVISEARSALAELKIDPVMYADVIGSALPAQKLIARAAGFNICRNRWIFSSDLDFVWRGNLRIALQGGNGTGKSTLLKALHGENFAMRGELTRGELSTLYLDQQCSLLDDTQSILANVRAVSSASDSEIRNALARFLFAGEQVFQPVAALSGGERLRAALARCFLSTQQPQLLLLDEPTNNLDLANIEFLEHVLRAFQGAMVIVSHDPVFLERCGITQIFDLQSGRES
jgi:ATPase subunit of ABC transporter with duplicated ATPase domains